MGKNKSVSEIKIEYERPKFYRVVFSIILDFLICSLLALLVFIGTKEIVGSTSTYKESLEAFNSLKVESQLYVYNVKFKRYEDIVTFYNESDGYSSSQVKRDLSKRIDGFISYMGKVLGDNVQNELKEIYNEFRLDNELIYKEAKYFVINDLGNIVENSEAKIPSSAYVENVYKKYIDNYALGQLIARNENALNYQRYLSNVLFYIEIPLAVFLSILITFYIIPLIVNRGKRTIGKLSFGIGYINKNILSPNAKEFTFYFLWLLLEILLSIVTFCIPLIISFSMMAFSKKRQSFAEYMLNLQIIDTYKDKIYKSKNEIVLEQENNQNDGIDFLNKRY